ncbi:MAG TPA: M1 family metallopeptidase [Saprospiraceae bacterium]|nr:M1 family metallopeptidase [Saprospiraceae bacterium]
MIRNSGFIFVILFTLSHSHAQYFQQQADYNISVTLDARQHILRGHWEMVYRNNSRDTLQTLIVYLYPNAYSAKNTAFAKQQLRLGITDFHFAKQSELGGMDSLDFSTDHARMSWSLDKDHSDIATLNLIQPLLPGAAIRISSPMRVKIPTAFSRLGRIDDSYQITQWYPKPAVYDHNGWHPLPYLNQGEFYGEVGTFDVRITLPEEYLVAATGELQTQEANHLLDSLAEAKNPPLQQSPPTTNRSRTWHYQARNVHDFALFADTRFAVRKRTIRIGEKDVDCWAFFTAVEQKLWENATTYLSDALQFYSEHVGNYPYSQMTAVQVPLGRDFGMEYPMITSINMAGKARILDDVLAHEVGHNWFYGALASNERQHPWMDEGINTFYEYLYLREKYQSWSEHILPHKPVKPNEMSDEQRILQHMSYEQQLVAPDTDPEHMTDLQVLFGIYVKPALAFHMLQEYMGEHVFASAMREYFDTWKFRHPQPSDLQELLSRHCDCDLSWLFDELLGTDHLIDYRIADMEAGVVTLENRGKIMAPVHLIAYKDSQIVFENWLEGFDGQYEIIPDIPDADRLQIYDEIYSLDLTPSDNVMWLNGDRAVHAKLKLRVRGGKQYPGEQYLNLVPVIGWNDTDKELIGLAISNTYWPPGKLQWAAVPLYSTKTKSLTGVGEIRYRHVSDIKPYNLEFGLGFKSFHFVQDTHYGFFDRYLKIAPRIRLGFGNQHMPQAAAQYLQYRFIYVHQNYGQGIDYEDFIWEEKKRSYSFHEIKYVRERTQNLITRHFEATLHAGKGFVRIMGDMRQRVAYQNPQKALYIHAFGGALPYYDNPKANVNFNFNGIQSNGFFSRDYAYDELLFARNDTKGFASQLVFLKDAQLKTLYTGGISDRWMLSAGFATDIPLPIPLQPYMDVAMYNDPFEDGVGVSYSGGLALVLKKNVFEIYVPLLESKDIRHSLTYLDRDSIFERISILLDLKAFHPFNYKGY